MYLANAQPPDQLYPYQEEGVDWLAGRYRGLLADEPGLGKSAQVVVAADRVCASSILIIPPAAVRLVWRDQINKWSLFGHDINIIVHGDQKPIKNMVNIVNYDLLSRGFAGKVGYKRTPFLKAFSEIEWDVVNCDEGHLLKEQESLRTMAVLANDGIAGAAKRLWITTGTPMPNHPGELWTLLVALGATELEYEPFINHFCLRQTYGINKGKPYAANESTADELNGVMKKVMMRRYKQFVLPQLPRLRIDDFAVPKVNINLSEFFEDAVFDKKNVERKIREQEEFVTQVWAAAVASDGEMSTMDMVTVLDNVGAGCAYYRRWLGAVKAASLIDVIKDELETGAVKKIVLGCWHTQVIRFLEVRLKKFGTMTIDGSTSMNQRQKLIQNFATDDKRVGILQIAAAGTGTDGLQHGAHEAIIIEEAWSPHLNAQFIMRLHRIGQKWPVRARMARLDGTLDDYIAEVLTRKTKDIARVLGD